MLLPSLQRFRSFAVQLSRRLTAGGLEAPAPIYLSTGSLVGDVVLGMELQGRRWITAAGSLWAELTWTLPFVASESLPFTAVDCGNVIGGD